MHSQCEDISYLLHIFPAVGKTMLFILALVWLRLLVPVVQNELRPLRKPRHKFGHPLPSQSAGWPEQRDSED